MKGMQRFLPLLLPVATLLLAACPARRGEPLKGALDDSDPEVRRGRIVFMSKCHKCHPGGDAGLGPALNNKPLPDFLVGYQTRHGAGAMPAFDADEIPDAQLREIAAYLEALRRNGDDTRDNTRNQTRDEKRK